MGGAQDPAAIADELRKSGVKVVVVGVGNGVDRDEMNGIAGSGAYFVRRFEDLLDDKFIMKMTQAMCPQNTSKRTRTTTTTTPKPTTEAPKTTTTTTKAAYVNFKKIEDKNEN